LLAHEVAASQAYARALGPAGILSEKEMTSIIVGLNAIVAELNGALPEDDQAEDIHHYVERQLAARIGDAAYKLHSGRSRNEQIATDLRLFVRDAIDAISAALLELCSATLEQAEAAGDAPMPAYTHLQRAEPVLIAHWLLAYFEMFWRDLDRLADCRKRVNQCPLGSGAVAGSTLKLDRDAIARELGFDAPTANSMDATSDRDFAIEFAQVCSTLAMHLSRWSEEFILFATQEFGFVALPEAYSTGSSAMPQKQNPDVLELIRGKCGRVLGAATALLTTAKGLPLAYNKDLQESQQPVFDVADTMTQLLPHAAGFLRAVKFDQERMRAAAGSHFMNAFAAATYLAQKGVPFRRAHEIVGAAVRICLEKKCELQQLTLPELQSLAPEFAEDFFPAMQLDAVLDVHNLPGGTARGHVKAALQSAAQRLSARKGHVHACA